MQLIKTLDVKNELGEGVIWDHVELKLWWTDIQQSRLYRYDIETEELKSWPTPERLCCFALRESGQGIVAGFESGFAFYQPDTNRLEWLHKIEQDNQGTRLNDGRTDRQGRLWAGTMVENSDLAPYQGSLYCLGTDLSLTKTLTNLVIPNSLSWSPDGEIMYHTDTVEREIKSYPFCTETGELGEAKVLLKTNEGCYPDGSTVDAEGYLWNAQWGSSTVVRYTPDGRQDLVLDIPAQQPSCVAFGGEELNLLCVTSAWQDLDAEARQKDSQAGNLFIFETPFTGTQDQPFKT